ncbi:hypothetical protein BT96DRAFT_562846 [Gymnopus androsaceus JB14]|uniref:Uncharacterized protein n=1 Tax=Gymnopus androsaceus JB14 TaxID=1447944 RepID=A0A6A4I031_9AGAR|nr:hypothetical protein BT96DRAFT_562846 [Gymnopus androsaceus JB14]
MTDCPTSTLLFTGRETILNILEDYFITDMMSEDIGRRKLFLLHGLGGAGKTQCALEFARKFKKSFSDIYFITAESENSIKASYYDIAMRNGSIPAQGWESGFRWFKTHEANWLIIMDNADDPQLSLGRFLPSCDHGNIIITSRNPDLMQIAAKSEEIKDMEPDDATQLLLKHAIKNQVTAADETSAGIIAKELHYFALALVQAGAYINQHKCLNNYLDLLKSQQAELLRRDISQSLDNYTMSIYSTWNLSWNKLEKSSKALLNICAYLHYERIPYALFQRAIENIEDLEISESKNDAKKFLVMLATESMKWDIAKTNEIIHKIGSYSLLNVIQDGLFSFHPLVHKWMMAKMDINLKNEICLGVQGIVAASINGTKWNDIGFVRLLTPHCIALEKYYIGELHIRKSLGRLWLMGHYGTRALTYWKPLMEETKVSFGNDHSETLVCMGHLAMSYRNLGRYNEALELQKPLLEVSRQVMGEEHLETLTYTNNLAMTYSHLGRYNEALELQKPLLEVSKQVMGEEHPETLTRTNDLARTYSYLGRYNEALELRSPSLKFQSKSWEKSIHIH